MLGDWILTEAPGGFRSHGDAGDWILTEAQGGFRSRRRCWGIRF